jgi:hypothetical protein
LAGGYLWSPKRARKPFYESMRAMSPGDAIFSRSKFSLDRYAVPGVAVFREVPRTYRMAIAARETVRHTRVFFIPFVPPAPILKVILPLLDRAGTKRGLHYNHGTRALAH